VSLPAVLLFALLLTAGFVCGCALIARAIREADNSSALRLAASDLAAAVPTDAWRDFLLRGTSASTADELAKLALEVAEDIDVLTLRGGWGDAMKRWDTVFRVAAEKRSLRLSGPQYRAARAIGSRRVSDLCTAHGAAAGPPPDPDDLDRTRDGSSGVRA
jgi:hypothetical protein